MLVTFTPELFAVFSEGFKMGAPSDEDFAMDQYPVQQAEVQSVRDKLEYAQANSMAAIELTAEELHVAEACFMVGTEDRPDLVLAGDYQAVLNLMRA